MNRGEGKKTSLKKKKINYLKQERSVNIADLTKKNTKQRPPEN